MTNKANKNALTQQGDAKRAGLKMSAPERRKRSLEALDRLLEEFNAQQLEGVTDMLDSISKATPHMNIGDNINFVITKKKDNRLSVKTNRIEREELSHFHRTVLGVCRQAHIYCLQNDKEFNFQYVKRGLYKLLFPRRAEDQEKANLTKMQAHKIYREYYKKVKKLRATNYASHLFSELQEEFPEVNLQRLAELFITMLEARQFRIAIENIEMIATFLCIAHNRTLEWSEE